MIFQIIGIYLCMLRVSRHLKSQFNSFANMRFAKSRSAVTSLVPYLDFFTRLVGCATYVEFRSIFGLVPHTVMQIKLWPLAFRCLNWFLGYLAIRQFVISISGYSLVFWNTSWCCTKTPFWRLCFFICSQVFFSVIKYSRCLPFDDVHICSCCWAT